MSNNEFKDEELGKFIKRFSGEDYTDDYFIGVEFKFRNGFYRVTRHETLGSEETLILKKRFGKVIGKYEVMKLPIDDYPGHYDADIDTFIGLYDTIDDLLENCKIDGVLFREIITSQETEFLGFD